MKKTIKLLNLDCAHCAAKIENALTKIDNIIDVKVNFLSQKITIEISGEEFSAVLADIKKIVKKIEPDVVLL